MIVVAMLSRLAASAVTGPMHATSTCRNRSAARAAPIARAKFLTLDPLVNVTTSTPRPRSSPRTSGPSPPISAGTVR